MKKFPQAEIGVFGGSGFYELFSGAEEIEVNTPYGRPSDAVTIGEIADRKVAFLPRHGRRHYLAPQSIPYRANLWAMKELGVTRIIAPSAAGSLKSEVQPGDFVICDQFINRTYKREDTFYPGPKTVHIGMAEPYCSELRNIVIGTCKQLNIPVHKKGTVAVIEGPRFSTKAESKWYSSMGWEIINMTQYPEVVLARELEICYVNISLITDYDAGLEGNKDIKPVTAREVIKIFNQNVEQVKKLIFAVIKNIPEERRCSCGEALEEAEA